MSVTDSKVQGDVHKSCYAWQTQKSSVCKDVDVKQLFPLQKSRFGTLLWKVKNLKSPTDDLKYLLLL